VAGAIVGGAGAALITAGIVRYLLVASRAPDRSTVAAAIGPRGAAVAWSARF
jgi:hypothetical protein